MLSLGESARRRQQHNLAPTPPRLARLLISRTSIPFALSHQVTALQPSPFTSSRWRSSTPTLNPTGTTLAPHLPSPSPPSLHPSSATGCSLPPWRQEAWYRATSPAPSLAPAPAEDPRDEQAASRSRRPRPSTAARRPRRTVGRTSSSAKTPRPSPTHSHRLAPRRPLAPSASPSSALLPP